MFQFANKAVLELCEIQWKKYGYVKEDALLKLADNVSNGNIDDSILYRIYAAFNGNDSSLNKIRISENNNDKEAVRLLTRMSSLGLGVNEPYEVMPDDEWEKVWAYALNNPDAILSDPDCPGYAYYSPGRKYLYGTEWVRNTLRHSKDLLKHLQDSRNKDIAVLAGNGPSLNEVDFRLLKDQDVFVSNYAVKHPELSKLAKGVAVTNYLVAEQEPYYFVLTNDKWKFFPFWLRHIITPDEHTIYLNAKGGDLFFSDDITKQIAWHSTVSYFMLQILYNIGYKKVVMIGFDHNYNQKSGVKEGDILDQKTPDMNHFDPAYFQGKKWQAADTTRMEQTYRLAKYMYEADGREIVNCTHGGKLEVFRRGELGHELGLPETQVDVDAKQDNNDVRILVVTAFWKGDYAAAERHWRLINRLGRSADTHIHVFKHGVDSLPPVTFENMYFADIERLYPALSSSGHPVPVNLMFHYTLLLARELGYSHFFWLEPDCIPVSKEWLEPFRKCAEQYPEAPIVGVGGGTMTPNSSYWKHHFAGCSLYNVNELLKLDWSAFIRDENHISFDIWMSLNLGYIRLLEIDNSDNTDTIIVGNDRYKWELVQKPDAVVTGMFEHWRPEKVLTTEQLKELVKASEYNLYHAIKQEDIVNTVFSRISKSASVIIINYNNGPYLHEAIESAVNQKYIDDINYQVIVVDDGSTDNSREIIESFGDRICPIFLSHGDQVPNFNQQRALLAALEKVQGDVVLLLDGDDIFHEEKVSNIVSYFDDPNVVLAQHDIARIDSEGRDLNNIASFFSDHGVDFDIYSRENRTNFYQPTSGLAFRKTYLKKVSQFLGPDNYPLTWLDVRLTRFAPAYGKVVCTHAELGKWRRHEKSDSIREDNLVERLEEHHEWFNLIGGEYSVSVDFRDSRHYKELIARRRRQNNLVDTNKSGLSVAGPYPRFVHAHFDETFVVGRLFKDYLKGSIMIDVGAHYGESLVPFLNMNWLVYAFEPDLKNRDILIEKYHDHPNYENLTLEQFAAGESSETGLPFYTSGISTGISSLSAFNETHSATQSVDVISLKDYLHDKEVVSIDYLKIDAEGHDLFVLKGFPWDRYIPAVIECEFEDNKTRVLGYTSHDMAKFLLERGYHVYVSEWHPVLRYGTRHDWMRLTRYPCELSSGNAWGNLIAFRDDIPHKQLVEAVGSQLKFYNSLSSLEQSGYIEPRASSFSFDKTLFVIGNGPSINGAEFSELREHDTVGMNAACRYWGEIGVYPTYYCCLDSVLVESLADEIHELVANSNSNGIKLFFLHNNLLNQYPELSFNPRIIFFDQFKYRYPFSEFSPVTTGAGAALFGMAMGYKSVCLLGIDGYSIEEIPGAERLEDNVLEITEELDSNPNYFFGSYQRKGDKYHVPNSKPNLHLNSWKSVDKISEELKTDVINCNPKSKVRAFRFGDWRSYAENEKSITQRHENESVNIKCNALKVKSINIYNYNVGNNCRIRINNLPLNKKMILAIAFDAIRTPLLGYQIKCRTPSGEDLPWRINTDCIPHLFCVDLPYGIFNRSVVLDILSPDIEDGHSSDMPEGRIYLYKMASGSRQYIPSQLFNGLDYLVRYKDVAEEVCRGNILDAYQHYIHHGCDEHRTFALSFHGRGKSGAVGDYVGSCFDGVKYLQKYHDVRSAVLQGHIASAEEHYLHHGRFEDRAFIPSEDNLATKGTAHELFHEMLSGLDQRIDEIEQ